MPPGNMEKEYQEFLFNLFQIEREKLAYFAGLFDGEGYLSYIDYPNYKLRRTYNIYSREGKSRTLTSWTIGISLTTPQPLYELQQVFGGTIKSRQRNTHKRIFYWSLWGLKAKSFLELLMPYLIIKKNQAEIALQLYTFYRQRGTISSHRRQYLQSQLMLLKHVEYDENGSRKG